MKTQYTDEFGGYSKTWFADGLKQCEDDNDQAGGGDFGLDGLAIKMGLDIEAIAIRLAKEGNLPPVQTHIFIEPKRA